jgi:hypothetical protein
MISLLFCALIFAAKSETAEADQRQLQTTPKRPA